MTFTSQFTAENYDTETVRAGTIENEYVVAGFPNDLKIVSQTGKVTFTKK